MDGSKVNQNLEKIAMRLAYLWWLRDANPQFYLEHHLGVEKENISIQYPEAAPLALQFFRELERRD